MRKMLWALLVVTGIMIVFAGGLAVAATISPWPGAFLITRVFSGGDAASEAALEKHVPADIETQTNLRYGDGRDEVFDISRPAGHVDPLPLVLWVHGGGWVGGSKEGVANYLKILASRGYAVAGIDYSRAPRATYPTPTRQTLLALAYLTANAERFRIDPKRIALAGDSAGAQISGQSALVITDPDYARRVGLTSPMPPESLRAMVLVSGAFDMTDIELDGPYGWFVRTVLWAYSGVKDFMNDEQFTLASITPHLSEDFPPTFITSGDADPLEPQARRLHERLDVLGVPSSALFFDPGPALNHEYQFNLDTPEGREALEGMTDFLNEFLATN